MVAFYGIYNTEFGFSGFTFFWNWIFLFLGNETSGVLNGKKESKM